MTRYARVDSLDALQSFKVALVKFAEASMVAMADAESEVSRTLMWLENEQTAHWQNQIRKRHLIVERCKEAVRAKKLFKDATGRQQSAFDEEKALRRAVLAHEEAEQKLAATRKFVNVMRREEQNFKGGLQRFHTCVEADIPAAVAQLSNMLATLKQYVAAAPTAVGSDASTAPAPVASMARGEAPDEPPTAAPADPKKPTSPDNPPPAVAGGS